MPKIPFLDLVTFHAELKDELLPVFSRALETAGFIGGPMVEEFERDFAAHCTTQHCVGVGSGTDALRFALIAAGVSGQTMLVRREEMERIQGFDEGLRYLENYKMALLLSMKGP
jgi:DegT/DnrJ/EryC1/StrS aminotransferase family